MTPAQSELVENVLHQRLLHKYIDSEVHVQDTGRKSKEGMKKTDFHPGLNPRFVTGIYTSVQITGVSTWQ